MSHHELAAALLQLPPKVACALRACLYHEDFLHLIKTSNYCNWKDFECFFFSAESKMPEVLPFISQFSLLDTYKYKKLCNFLNNPSVPCTLNLVAVPNDNDFVLHLGYSGSPGAPPWLPQLLTLPGTPPWLGRNCNLRICSIKRNDQNSFEVM